MPKQLALMHKHFGKNYAHKCGTCSNFVKGEYHGKALRKCKRYGLSHSLSSDWAQSWMACGMHNKSLLPGERPLKEYAGNGRKPLEELPGQVGVDALIDCGKGSRL